MIKRITINFFLIIVFCAIMTVVTLLFSAEIKFNAANQFIRNKQWEKAQVAYPEVLAIVPFCAKYWMGYGDFIWDQSDANGTKTPWPQIEAAYQQAIRVNPLDAEGWIKLGQVQADRDDRKAAYLSFQKAKELDPNGTDTAYWMEEYKDLISEF